MNTYTYPHRRSPSPSHSSSSSSSSSSSPIESNPKQKKKQIKKKIPRLQGTSAHEQQQIKHAQYRRIVRGCGYISQLRAPEYKKKRTNKIKKTHEKFVQEFYNKNQGQC